MTKVLGNQSYVEGWMRPRYADVGGDAVNEGRLSEEVMYPGEGIAC